MRDKDVVKNGDETHMKNRVVTVASAPLCEDGTARFFTLPIAINHGLLFVLSTIEKFSLTIIDRTSTGFGKITP